jgi:enterochelin esterase-like enzyme
MKYRVPRKARLISHAFLSISVLFAAGLFFVDKPLTTANPNISRLEVTASPQVIQRSFWSNSLRQEMPFSVYLPQGYGTMPDQRYPVLYMLHGLGGSYTEWDRQGLFAMASQMIEAGQIPPMIIVLPEGRDGYWVDHAANGPAFGSYVARDLVKRIDTDYRTIPRREARAIGGMSMGGHGALQLAFRNPDEFGIVGAHSVALRTFEQAFSFFGDRQYFTAHDPVSLAMNAALATRFTLWLDIGASDVWLNAAQAFHEQLASAGIAHRWTVFKGGHDGLYWTQHTADYLRFYGQAFVDLGGAS